MSHRRLVRRPEFEPRSEAGADLSAGWREFVLEQVGHDEPARERAAWWAELRHDVRRFLGGLLFGLFVFALALAAGLAMRSWRTGKLDRYLPEKGEEVVMPSPPQTRDRLPAEAGKPDTHANLPNPLYQPARTPSDGADDDGSASTETDAGDSGD